MPRDANGVFSLVDGYLAITGATIQASQHNPPLEDIASALTGSLPRNGTAPMTAPIRLVDGSSSLPAISFNSDPTSGFYKDGNFIAASKPLKGVLPVGLGPLPWSRVTAPAGWVFCYGQTLSRTAYPDLWAVAQAEIAAGSLLYNNGDGALTFGILDMRGRVAAGADNIGGASAGRLSAAMVSTTMGSTGGVANYALTQGNLPAVSYNLAGTPATISVNSTRSDITVVPTGSAGTYFVNGPGSFRLFPDSGTFYTGVNSTGSYTPAGTIGPLGSGGAFNLPQPTIITSSILYAGA
jgi:microcystin-dependent protein